MKQFDQINHCPVFYGKGHFSPPQKFDPERQLLRGGPGDVPIVHILYDTYSGWNEILLKFPKAQRYTLGDACSRNLLTVLESVIGAASLSNMIEKSSRLKDASAKIDATKLLIRLAKDCRCITNVQYLKVESQLIEAGKMLGGWLKTLG